MAEPILYNTGTLAFPGGDAMQAFNQKARIAAYNRVLSRIKNGIWIYFWLLIFEGALRKWVLPGLATPLLVVRDPIAIWLIVYGYLNGFLKTNFYVVAVIFITAVSFVTTLLSGHGSVLVALYGARIVIVHFPLVFLISKVFTRADIIKMGKAFLMLSLLQTVVASLQFYSPQSAWINKGVGGEQVAGFMGALGFLRPPGTFSFTNGLSAFYGLVAPFIAYFWLVKNTGVKKWLLIASTVAFIIAIPISISRTVLFEAGLTAFFTLIIAFKKPGLLIPVTGAAIGLIAVFLLLSNTSFFNTGVAAFTDRFTSATAAESGSKELAASSVTTNVYDRFFGGIFTAIESSDQYPFFGLGLGYGTNAGAQYLTGKTSFTIAEAEWGRVIGEMGVILGLLFIIFRVIIAGDALIKGYRAIRFNNYLPWLMASFTFTIFVQGQWAQPTALGFAILGMGLNLAAFQKEPNSSNR